MGYVYQDSELATDLISQLEKSKVTVEILTKTAVGASVNTLRKRDGIDKSVASRAKALVKGWKKLLPSSGNGSAAATPPTTTKSSSQSLTTDNTIKSSSAPSAKKETSGGDRAAVRKTSQTQKVDLPRAQETGNQVRDSCRKMLATGILTGREGICFLHLYEISY